MSCKNRLVFTYYNILRFYCFKKSLQSVLKTWQVLKSEKKFFERRPNIGIPFFKISNPDFLGFFSVITGTV